MPSSFKYSMTVRFIRAEDVAGSGKHDDRATITNHDGDVYNLSFHHNDGKKKITKEMLLDYDGVISWFNRTLRFVDADYVPYARYQFDFPMMPSIMIAHQELHHHHKVIMSAVRFHMNYWITEDDYCEDEDDDNCEDECCEEAPAASTLPDPNTIDWGRWFTNDQYESNKVDDCCNDDNSSVSTEEYDAPSSKHKFFDEDTGATSQVKKMVQRMEQNSKSSASNLRR